MTLPQTGEIPAWSLGDRLRKAREHARLTQQELADQTGISRASVVNYETDKAVPSRPVLLSWALLCRVDLAWLVGSPHPGLAQVRMRQKVKKPGRCAVLRGPFAAVAA